MVSCFLRISILVKLMVEGLIKFLIVGAHLNMLFRNDCNLLCDDITFSFYASDNLFAFSIDVSFIKLFKLS